MPFRLSKNDILHFCKNAEGLGEQRVNTFAPQMSAINGCPHLLRCGFPKFNPQSEFTSDEENSTFQGIFMPMERTVYTYSNLVKILILTKGVDFFDTLKKGGLEVPPFPMPLPELSAPCALQWLHLPSQKPSANACQRLWPLFLPPV